MCSFAWAHRSPISPNTSLAVIITMIITMITKIILAIIKSHHRNYTRQVGWTRGTSAERCVWTSSAWRLRRNRRWWASIIVFWLLGIKLSWLDLTRFCNDFVFFLSSSFSDWEDNDKVRRWLRLDFWSPLQLPRLWRASSSTETYQWWRSLALDSLSLSVVLPSLTQTYQWWRSLAS